MNPVVLKRSVKETELPIKCHSFNQTMKVKLPGSMIFIFGRCGGLMVRTLDLRSSSPVLSAVLS